VGRLSDLLKRRQEQRGQDGNNGDNNKQFNQREGMSGTARSSERRFETELFLTLELIMLPNSLLCYLTVLKDLLLFVI
jgi:hypothetical protein